MDSRQARSAGGFLGRGTVARILNRNTWLLVSAGALFLLLSPLACALRHQGSNRIRAEVQPVSEVVLAECGADLGEAKAFTATLSEEKKKVELHCQGNAENKVVPDKLTDGLVCPATVATLAECEAQGAKQPVSLSTILGGVESSGVKWVESAGTGQTGKKYELSLPGVPLPLLDATFVTGCSQSSKSDCKLTVKVEARKSVATGQTVNCAYGANSNEKGKRPTVTMTTKDNTMTLICGNQENTSVYPASYTTDYCTDETAGDNCKTEKYANFIKEFKTTWWSKGQAPQSVTLTIPPEQFPDTAKTVRLGCHYKSSTTDQTKSPSGAAPTACAVDVVISAKDNTGSGRTVAYLPGLTLAAVVLSVTALVWF
ncbi:srs domain-containing protein [Cystoisospora suis]|uniref:Srs domain-containing protein n=1 Tax=Cystoisospora suis TaxID=483139 RepID=A0A2C6KG05_9APIC|nr:srs domain-containing protein [Cystoisospora suis]